MGRPTAPWESLGGLSCGWEPNDVGAPGWKGDYPLGFLASHCCRPWDLTSLPCPWVVPLDELIRKPAAPSSGARGKFKAQQPLLGGTPHPGPAPAPQGNPRPLSCPALSPSHLVGARGALPGKQPPWVTRKSLKSLLGGMCVCDRVCACACVRVCDGSSAAPSEPSFWGGGASSGPTGDTTQVTIKPRKVPKNNRDAVCPSAFQRGDAPKRTRRLTRPREPRAPPRPQP